MADRIRNFASDNTAGAAPEILEALAVASRGAANPYGVDALSERLAALAREIFETELAIFPVATGTAANALALAHLVPPHGAVYCHESAHIMGSEAGAPEFLSGGAKLVGLPGAGGKIDAAGLAAPVARAFEHGVHQSLPAAISISQASEAGTVYTPAEVGALAEFGRTRRMALHMDGARFANALVHLGCAPADITWRQGVAALSLGATKNGALAAEAVVFFDPKQAEGFAWRRKRAGHLWSKSRFIAAQLVAYLENGLWLGNAARANEMAARLGRGLAAMAEVKLLQPVESNQVFAALPAAMIDGLLAAGFAFYRWPAAGGATSPAVRLVTSFEMEAADIDGFLAAAQKFRA